MARANFLYHVYLESPKTLLATFTVKREAHDWVWRSPWDLREVALYRVRDGIPSQHVGDRGRLVVAVKQPVYMAWDDHIFDQLQERGIQRGKWEEQQIDRGACIV